MHTTAKNNCQSFFDCYVSSTVDNETTTRVIEIGSQDVNGNLREIFPKHFDYVGVDFIEAKGVDVVVKDPYSLPFENDSADIVLSSSCLEHSEMFWLVFLEIMRVLKPAGLFYLNVPSTGPFHRYPVDCWRFYPDSGRALVNWARRNGVNAAMLESYTQIGGGWQDFVAIFLKNETLSAKFPNRIINKKTDFENGQLLDSDKIYKQSKLTQDGKKLLAIRNVIAGTTLMTG